MAKRPTLTLLACAALALGACGQIREELGVSKSAPDEFRVVTHAPLAMPPDASLRPPAPGMARPQEGSPTEQARVAVFGIPKAAEPRPLPGNPADQSFLRQAGAEKIDPNIRSEIDAETAAINRSDESFLDAIVFWRDDPPPGVVVDPEKEAQRIRGNQALGEPVTDGQTPTIEHRQKGLFEGLF